MSAGTILGIVLFIAVTAFWTWQGSDRISSADARKLVAEGAVLLDVRSPGEFASGHLEGAVNIPIEVLEGRMLELGEQGVAIVVYCRSGARSARASQLLSSAGFQTVADLGAMSRW